MPVSACVRLLLPPRVRPPRWKRAPAHERDQVGRVDCAPAGLGGLDQREHHRQAISDDAPRSAEARATNYPRTVPPRSTKASRRTLTSPRVSPHVDELLRRMTVDWASVLSPALLRHTQRRSREDMVCAVSGSALPSGRKPASADGRGLVRLSSAGVRGATLVTKRPVCGSKRSCGNFVKHANEFC